MTWAPRVNASDSVQFLRACRERGCETIVSLGGDGTNRLIARTFPDAQLIPLSTGTNNVFPIMIEATAAGEAAGLVATGKIQTHLQRCKVIHIRTPAVHDIAVIDALLLVRDHVGNMLPFEPDKMRSLLLTRAEPAAVGTSPIGGMLQPVWAQDDHALAVNFGSGGRALAAPLSPGLFRKLAIRDYNDVALGRGDSLARSRGHCGRR